MLTLAVTPNLGGPELLIILLIFILLFGARKLPDLGSSIGKSIKNFKKGVDEGREDDVPSLNGSTPASHVDSPRVDSRVE